MTCQQYHETFCNNVDIKYCGGIISKDTGLVNAEPTLTRLTRVNTAPGQLHDAEDAAQERVLACAFLLGSNWSQYGRP
jgi:hypothetical protein